MPHRSPDSDTLSNYLLPPTRAPRKSPSRQSLSLRRSSASLRGPSPLSNGTNDDGANGRHHSLAHELAVALMPEPSAGSKLLAEEFGIEFDEGAEGIDDDQVLRNDHGSVLEDDVHASTVQDSTIPSFADEFAAQTHEASFADGFHPPDTAEEAAAFDLDPVFGSTSPSSFVSETPTKTRQKTPEKDAIDVLSENLESTEKFLVQLRTLDSEHGTSLSQQPKLERYASDIVRRMNESVRDRESQVRDLIEYEREFRKIAGEVGGTDILGQLDELENGTDDLSDSTATLQGTTSTTTTTTTHTFTQPRELHTLEEEASYPQSQPHYMANDWELDPERNHLGDADYDSSPIISPIKDSFSLPQPPPLAGPITPAKAIPHLSHIRTVTTSLVSSLTSISESAQVTGVATAEAGRKIRSLKNRLGDLRTEWELAEKSKVKIERWEAGIVDTDDGPTSPSTPSVPATPTRLTGKRIDGRKIVEEHLRAFERALADAALKTQAIMAR